MTYSRAFSTLGCPDFTLKQALALAASHKLQGVELRALADSLDIPAYLAANFETPQTLAKRMRDEPIKIVAFGTPLRLVGGTPAERENFLAFVPWAEALHVPWLRVFDGGIGADQAGLNIAVDAVHWWRELRTKNGWRTDLMVETHDSLLTAAKVERFLAAVPGTAILWDTHHTWKMGNEEPLVTWRALRPHIVHVHVKDSISRPSARTPYTYVLPGTGEFPAATLFGALKTEFNGMVSLESEKMGHPYLPPLDLMLQAASRNAWW